MSLAPRLLSNLKTAIASRGSGGKPPGPPRVHASSIGACARQQTYRMLGYPTKPSDYYGLLQADQGQWIEDGAAKLMEQAGFILDGQQTRVEYKRGEDIVLSGYTDGRIREDTGDLPSPWYLWECKGMSAFRYRKLATAQSVRDADPGYYDQVQVYMTILNETEELEGCLFTAFAKDPSALNSPRNGKFLDPIYVEEISWDPVYGAELLDRANMLYDLAIMDELGPRERIPGKDWDCSKRFCAFFDECDPKGAQRKGYTYG